MSDNEVKPAADKAPVENKIAPMPALKPVEAARPMPKPVEAAKPVPTPAVAAKPAPKPVEAAKPVVKPAKAATVSRTKIKTAAKARKPAAKKKPAAAPIKTVTKGTIMNDTVKKTADTAKAFAQDAQNKATALFGDMNARTKTAMERSTKMFEDMNEFSKGNVEALVESSKLAAKAAETLSQSAAETARKNFETATQAMKSFASVKTPTEFFQLQSEYARTAFDSMISEASRSSETMLKMAGDVFQPLSNRFAVAAEKIKIAA